MVSELAKGDWLDLAAQGLNPTLEDFDRLNCIALRLTDGDETTCANFPRVGWAGDVPFYEPTVQALAWYNASARRAAANAGTLDTFWAFALAHAREPGFFAALDTPAAIEKAVAAWADALPVTHDEVMRACRYAADGFDDAVAAKNDPNPRRRASGHIAARNLLVLEERLAAAAAALHVPPDALKCETLTRLDRLCAAAAVELGREMRKNEASLRADYDLTLREIVMRLRKAKEETEAARA